MSVTAQAYGRFRVVAPRWWPIRTPVATDSVYRSGVRCASLSREAGVAPSTSGNFICDTLRMNLAARRLPSGAIAAAYFFAVALPAAAIGYEGLIVTPKVISPDLSQAYARMGARWDPAGIITIAVFCGVLLLVAICAAVFHLGTESSWAVDRPRSTWRVLKWSAFLFVATWICTGFPTGLLSIHIGKVAPSLYETDSVDPLNALVAQLLLGACLLIALMWATDTFFKLRERERKERPS